MNKLDYCYHTHTKRCGHAIGEDEEYVLKAIESGLKELGFSDHVMLPGIIHPNIRGDYSMLDNYVDSINKLKEKYKKKINIHIGFEAEYMEEYVDYYKELLKTKKIEYLILGQHCYYENNHARWYEGMRIEKGLKRYTDHLIKGIESGLFSYVAHPDLFAIFYPAWDENAIECSKRIIEAAEKHNIPLEINLCKVRALYGGYLRKEYPNIYPILPFWELVAHYNVKVIVGIDAHNPEHIFNSALDRAIDLINKSGVKVDFNYRLK